jgi:hypothetical protein
MSSVRYSSSFVISTIIYVVIIAIYFNIMDRPKPMHKPKEHRIKIAIITPPIPPKIKPKPIVKPKPLPLKNSVTINGLTYQNQPFIKEYTWQEAKKYCQGLTLNGYRNWRLPNKEELKSIMTKNKIQGHQKRKYYIRPEFVQNLRGSAWFRTSTENSSSTWGVYFYGGYDGWLDKEGNDYALCVHDTKDIIPKPLPSKHKEKTPKPTPITTISI